VVTLKLTIFQVLLAQIRKEVYKAMKKLPLFTNKVGVLATMHQKEKVIAPILEQ
jgi:hypothetical protein